MRKALVLLAICATLGSGSVQARDNTAAILGGVAVGAVGGVVLGSVLSQPRAPVYAQPAPIYASPAPVYAQPAPMVQPAPYRQVVSSPFDDQAYNLKGSCDRGNRNACIRFGVLIGKHQERVASWRHSHPDFFSYED